MKSLTVNINLYRLRWVCNTIDLTSPTLGTTLYTNHCSIPISPEPCFIGRQVNVYANALSLCLRQYIFSIKKSFKHDHECYVHHHKIRILAFGKYTQGSLCQDFYNSVFNFQREAVKDWDGFCNDVTLSYNMGFVGVRED